MVKRLAVCGLESASEVLTAARSKWNFLKFGLGLAGDCRGIAPYSLTSRAQHWAISPNSFIRDANTCCAPSRPAE